MSIIHDRTNQTLEQALDVRLHRQHLLASNVANADTPGYQPQDLEFEGALVAAAGPEGTPGPLARTDEVHLATAAPAGHVTDPRLIERPDVTDTLDHNGVDLDREMARSTDNAVAYRATVELARRRYTIIRQAISDMANT